MFDDIISPKPPKEDEEYEDHGFAKDDSLKKSYNPEDHQDKCNCNDCIEIAIKRIATKMRIDLNDDAIQDIKKEYLKRVIDPNMPICKWLKTSIGGYTNEKSRNL